MAFDRIQRFLTKTAKSCQNVSKTCQNIPIVKSASLNLSKALPQKKTKTKNKKKKKKTMAALLQSLLLDTYIKRENKKKYQN